MIFYLDTSAMIKLYIKEEGTEEVRELLESVADLAASSKVAFVEARAAMSRLRRDNILDKNNYQLVKGAFQKDWSRFLVVELTDMVIKMGAELTEKYALRGFDAIHLASALVLKKQVGLKVVAGCWDARLWDAFKDNMEVVPTSRP
jgi:predicted nucleic acid-binding protein